MAVALVAHVAASGLNTTTSAAIDTTGATFLVLHMAFYSGATAPTISDSKGHTWVGLTLQDSGGVVTQLFYVVNPTGGTSHTFTFTGTNINGAMSVAAFSGTLGTGVYDGHENGAVSSSGVTSRTTGSVTPSQSGCLLIAGLGLGGAISALVINAGFTITDTVSFVGGTHYGGSLAYFVQGAAAAINPTWSWTTATDCSAAIGVFKAAVVSFPGGDEGAVWYMTVEKY
jgi:hypothetical protein